jgi:hypothetical protein
MHSQVERISPKATAREIRAIIVYGIVLSSSVAVVTSIVINTFTLHSPHGYQASWANPLLGSQHTTKPLKLATPLTNKPMVTLKPVSHDACSSISEVEGDA